ncbi:MAG: hypothetical protein PHI32_02315 [Dysgonamonadaceae bacterium]|nr:hypothetical protein [Dysgonamonadaceae bacterium]MDD4727501.1 hypothetical protein [Dysgonamonadaceae bacterium]
MKEFAKYIGVLVMIIGVLFLVIPFLLSNTTNTNLLIGLLIVIEGFLGHIFVNNLKNTKTGNIIWMIALLVVPYFIFLYAKKTAYGEELEGLES